MFMFICVIIMRMYVFVVICVCVCSIVVIVIIGCGLCGFRLLGIFRGLVRKWGGVGSLMILYRLFVILCLFC